VLPAVQRKTLLLPNPALGRPGKCVFALVTISVVAALLLAVEWALRFCNYGYSTDYFIQSEGGAYYRENRQFGWQFFPHESAIIPNPVRFAAVKPPGVFRIFILGESAAAGSPNQAFGFGRILQVMLQEHYPENRFEVVNAAMRGVDSDVVLRIARECVRHEPDLFIIYMGNNEFVPFHTTDAATSARSRSLRQLGLIQAIKSTRLAQVAHDRFSRLSRSQPEVVLDTKFFRQHRLAPDTPTRIAVYNEFRSRFAEICDVTAASGAPVIACSVAVNLKDCPPFGSVHRLKLAEPDKSAWQARFSACLEAQENKDFQKAIQCGLAAEALDGQFAELQFRLAEAFLAIGRFDEAAKHFTKARDRDALQFRADSHINDILRAEVESRPSHQFHWIDLERRLCESSLSDKGIPGAGLFYDHVHFRFDGDYEVATGLFSSVIATLKLDVHRGPVPSRERCAELLAYTPWDESNLEHLMLQLTSRPPFLDQLDHASRQARAEERWRKRTKALGSDMFAEAVAAYRQAIGHNPNDWQLHFNFGFLLQYLRDFPSALDEFNRALELFPGLVNVKVEMGATCLQAGQVDEAIQHLTEAVRIDPHYRRAWQLLGQATKQQTNPDP
jgi:tetratricopeptide (TPR) repeat protein